MKRWITLLLAALLILLTACGKQEPQEVPAQTEREEVTENETPQQTEEEERTEDNAAEFDFRAYDWQALIESELFDESDLSMELRSLVTLEVTDVTAAEITLEVTAPDIYEDLTAWFNSVSDAEFSVEALDAKVRELLAGETKTQEFALPYDLVGGTPMLYYSEECLHAASGGMLTFYYDLYADMVEEVEAMEGA